MLSRGDCAPDVKLELPGGKNISPADFKGQKLVLFFCPGNEPSSWAREMHDFAALAGEFEHCGTWIIGLPGTPGKAQKIALIGQPAKVSFAADPDGSAHAAFGVALGKSRESITFLLDRDGTISRIWRGAKISGHAHEVLNAAQQLP